jgi:hypothetical protein
MPFEFTCPYCHHRTKVDDKYAGQTGPCVSCGKKVCMPRYNERGILVFDQVVTTPGKSNESVSAKNPVPFLVAAACVLTAIGTLVGAFFFAWPSIQKRAIVAAQSRDIDNMKQIAKALNEYADRYGTYPPPVVTDAAGKPLYSWRVLVLPFMGYESLYSNFRLDQPFDSPNNLEQMQRMPAEFASPSSDAAIGNQTNYVLITGSGTLFPPEGPLSPRNLDDPTLLLVETRHGMATWTEPGDIDISRGLRPGTRPLQDLGGLFKDSFTAVSVSGEGFRIPMTVPTSVLDSLVSPNGGEKVDTSEFR